MENNRIQKSAAATVAIAADAADEVIAVKVPPYATGWALFLDMDGTIVDLQSRPSAVVADRELVTLLRDLLPRADGAVALVSGRAVSDIERLFSPLALPVAGQHGAERRDARGKLHTHGVSRTLLRTAAAQLADFARRHAGLLLEDKGFSLALHYRGAPGLAQEVESEVRQATHSLGKHFEVQSGKMVWEMKPAGRNKGTAIAEFMAETPFVSRLPVFIGDDRTDEHGFELVNRMGGHSIKVGAGNTHARWRLTDAREVRMWLAGYLEFLRERAAG